MVRTLRSEAGTGAADWALKRGMRDVAARLMVDVPPERVSPTNDLERYTQVAHDLTFAFDTGDPAALQRLSEHYNRVLTWDDVQAIVWGRARTVREAKGRPGSFPVADAKALIARESGFGSWPAFENALTAGTPPLGAPYVIDAKENTLRPRRALTPKNWDAVIEVLKARRISSLNAGDHMTDGALERISRLDHVTRLHIGGSRQLTDEGLRHLARMPQLEELELSSYPGWTAQSPTGASPASPDSRVSSD